MLGRAFQHVVTALRNTGPLCTITLARGPDTMRAVGVLAHRQREFDVSYQRQQGLDASTGLVRMMGVREAPEELVEAAQRRSPRTAVPKYVAQVVYGDQVGIIGPFYQPVDAAAAYDEAVIRLCGISAAPFTNFLSHMAGSLGTLRNPIEPLCITRSFHTLMHVPIMCDSAQDEHHSVDSLLQPFGFPASDVPYKGVHRHRGGYVAFLDTPAGRVLCSATDLPIEAAVGYDAAVRARPELGLQTNFGPGDNDAFSSAESIKEHLFQRLDRYMAESRAPRKGTGRRGPIATKFGATVTRAHATWIKLQIIAFRSMGSNEVRRRSCCYFFHGVFVFVIVCACVVGRDDTLPCVCCCGCCLLASGVPQVAT